MPPNRPFRAGCNEIVISAGSGEPLRHFHAELRAQEAENSFSTVTSRAACYGECVAPALARTGQVRE
jgi:hypothetical protein